MPRIKLVSAVIRFMRERVTSRSLVVHLLLLFSLSTLPSWAQSPATPRGIAQVAVRANLTDDTPLDYILISMKGSDDKDLLLRISAALGEKFHMAPQFPSFERGTPPFSNGQLGLSFQLPTVTDGKTLPISAFLEAFAPYAENLRMVFMIDGQFAYQGYSKFENADFSFTVTQKSDGTNTALPFAFFDADAIIKNPLLAKADADVQNPTPAQSSRKKLTLYILFGLAIIIGVSGGLLITMLIKQSKGQHEREHDNN